MYHSPSSLLSAPSSQCPSSRLFSFPPYILAVAGRLVVAPAVVVLEVDEIVGPTVVVVVVVVAEATLFELTACKVNKR